MTSASLAYADDNNYIAQDDEECDSVLGDKSFLY
jgi:hypothetical protein